MGKNLNESFIYVSLRYTEMRAQRWSIRPCIQIR